MEKLLVSLVVPVLVSSLFIPSLLYLSVLFSWPFDCLPFSLSII